LIEIFIERMPDPVCKIDFFGVHKRIPLDFRA
jgi:hypothetical protein